MPKPRHRSDSSGDVPSRPLALLVDADNASAALIEQVLEEASKHGSVIIRRAYGDWTTPQLGPWKKILQRHALRPMQQFPNAPGKNSTDSSLIIDAMDLLHSGKVGGFCIVSSDSDYTSLVTRIREEGLFVLGIGKSTTPAAFKIACEVFVAVENLSRPTVGPQAAAPLPNKAVAGRGKLTSSVTTKSSSVGSAKPNPRGAVDILRRAFDVVASETGRAHLGALGAALLKLDSSFDPRTFGYSRLLTLLQILPDEFEIDRPSDLSDPAIYVRRKRTSENVTPKT